MADPQKAAHLKQLILETANISSVQSFIGPNITPSIREQLRQWLIAQDVPERKAYKASDYVLANAFRGGSPYVEKMRQEDSGFRASQRRALTGFSLDTAETEFAGQTLGSLLDQREPQIEAVSPLVSQQQPFAIAVDQIARAATAVIGPRLDQAKREMREEMTKNIEFAERSMRTDVDRRWTEALATFEAKTQGLVADAKEEVRRLVENIVPREIRITKRETTVRILPAEPRHEAFYRILDWLLIGENVYIVGPAGTGKTHLFKQLAEATGKKLYLPGQALTKYDISGYKGPTGEYFGTVVRDALEFGGLLAIDEGDMWAAAALGFLNAPLANGWCAFPDRTIEVHPDFQCLIAANTFGRGATQEYIGRNPLDAASLDRFVYETVDYDEDLERTLYGDGPWVEYIHRVRAAIREFRLQHVVSMRATARVTKGIAANLDPNRVLFANVWRGLDPDTVAKIKTLAGDPPMIRSISTVALELELEAAS